MAGASIHLTGDPLLFDVLLTELDSTASTHGSQERSHMLIESSDRKPTELGGFLALEEARAFQHRSNGPPPKCPPPPGGLGFAGFDGA
jgi:hypothetical protein